MQIPNYLGIYIGKDKASAVCLGGGRSKNILGAFSVLLEDGQKDNPGPLAALIARACAEKGLQFSEVAAALDCRDYMQHSVHSEFSDPKQIAAAVRFDTEEAIATDVSELAIAFNADCTDPAGSKLKVFTTEKKLLSEIVAALQANRLDPASIEPDVCCLVRFVRETTPAGENARTLYAFLGRNSGYLILPAGADRPAESIVRTFILGTGPDRTDVLAREIPVTIALAGIAEPLNRIRVLDSTASVNTQQLAEKLAVQTSMLDPAESLGLNAQVPGDCSDTVGFAIAYGAALAHLEKPQSTNWRRDFMPYLGRKMKIERAIRSVSISAVVLIIALGIYFQAQLMQRNKPIRDLLAQFAKDYSAVMPGTRLPSRSDQAVRDLKSAHTRIRNVQSGRLDAQGEEAVPAKLTLVLKAFNECAAGTNLNIDSISVTTRTISIAGDTSSKTNTLRLFDALKNNKLQVSQQNLTSKAGRDIFQITVDPMAQ